MKSFKSLSSAWIGIFTLAVVLYFGVFQGFTDISIFFNSHALILVFGGTIAIAMLSYPFSVLIELYDFIIFGFLMKKKSSLSEAIYNFLLDVYEIKNGKKDASKVLKHHNFVNDALRLVFDSKYSVEDAESILESIKDSFHKKYTEDAKIMINISKFPPALGLLGASTGMIQMMTNLGSGGAAAIGSAMAVALTATFWGIAVANFVFLPLADYAFRASEEDLFMRDLIIEGVIQIKMNAPYSIVVESTCGRLPVAERFRVMSQINKKIEQYNKHDKELSEYKSHATDSSQG